MPSTIRLLVVDDHPVVRDGLVAMLKTQHDFHVVGEAATGAQAVSAAAQLQPDVILLDLEMPDMDGVEALREMRAAHPSVQVLVFTAFDTDERIVSAVQAGAKGYLLKGVPRDDIFKAIRVISEGGSLLQPIVASKLMQHIAGQPSPTNEPDALSNRELEVLQLLAQGKSNKDIATTLVISERTAKFHVSSILSKLGASNRTEAARIAAQKGWVKLDDA